MPEKDEGQVTLASLRGRGSRAKAGRGLPEKVQDGPILPQMGLFAAEVRGEAETAEDAPSLVAAPHLMPARAIPGRTAREVPGQAVVRVQPAPDTSPWGGPEAGSVPRDVRAVPEKRVWTVRAIVADVRGRIEGGYGEVWVEGEISNCRPASSGHLYLTLKDGEAQLPVVLFRRQAQLLRFRPNAGMAVLVRGRLSVYEGAWRAAADCGGAGAARGGGAAGGV